MHLTTWQRVLDETFPGITQSSPVLLLLQRRDRSSSIVGNDTHVFTRSLVEYLTREWSAEHVVARV